MYYLDRAAAGQTLAKKLDGYAGSADVVVLALPRGGVPVAFQVACALRVPLDVFLVRKLGVPGREELALGAIASGGGRALNKDVIEELQIPDTVVEAVAREESVELERRERLYRGDSPPIKVQGKTVILVDDGLATGASMRAAVVAIREMNPGRIVVAVPVGSPETCQELRKTADEVICMFTPDPLRAVGMWFQDFSQTTDDEVQKLLNGETLV